MIGYSIFNKSINGIRTLSDGITIIENGIVTANDIKGQIKDKQNSLSIGTDLTIDSNLQVDEVSTLNQVYVNGTDLNAFISAVDSLLNDPDHTNPFLANVIFAGTAEFGNTMILTNQNFSVWNGVDYTTFPMSNLNFIRDMTGSSIQTQLNDKASKTAFNVYTGNNQYFDVTFFDANVLIRQQLQLDTSVIINNPTDTTAVTLTNTDMAKIRFIKNVTSDVNSSLNDKASLTGTNSFTQINTFEDDVYCNADLYCDTSVFLREIVLLDHFGPGLNFALSGPTLGAINYIKDLDRDIWILFDERPTFTYVDNALALKADTTYVDAQIASVTTPTFSGTLTAPTSTDLILNTTTTSNKVLVQYKLEVSGLSSSAEVLRVKGQSVFEQKVTLENNLILQNEQNPCLTATYGSTVTFANVNLIPKFCRVFGGITINLPTPPASGLNNGYEITFIKYSTITSCTINCTTSALYINAPSTGESSYSMTESVTKWVAIEDAWYKII